ncbi:hypothetical protein [Lichenibacterium ramalinae]|nr:hypothetical protein [Lichenibacterium ramalinae]
MSERPTRLDKTDASAGKSGVGVRYVLIGGLVLVIVLFAVIALVMSHSG